MAEQRVTILIETKHVGKAKGKEAESQVKKIGGSVKNLAKTTKAATGIMGSQVTLIAWHFRYLGNVMSQFGRQWQRIVKNAIETAATLQESFLSIEVAAKMFGEDAEKATKLAEELALKGLLPIVESADVVKNLTITGLGFPELEKLTYRYLDVAFLVTSGIDEMEKSLNFMTESIVRGTTVLGADKTAKLLWIKTEKRLKETMGITLKDLNARQRALEILKTIETGYAGTLDFHKIEQLTLRSALIRIKASVTLLAKAYGESLAPVVIVVSEYIGNFTRVITDLVKEISPTIAIITILGLAITTLTGTLATLAGVVLSVWKILNFATLTLGQFSLIFLGVNALLMAGTYLILKHVGAWDKMKQSMTDIASKIADIKSGLQDLGKTEEEGMEIDKEKQIAHERKTEDIMEDLERERSKGLWANQMTIKDLEKRLKRENEDWSRHLKERGKDTDEEGGMFGNLMDKIEDLGKTTEDEGKKIKLTWKKVYKSILDGFKKLPPAIQGLLAGILTYVGFTFFPKLLNLFKWSSIKNGAILAFNGIKKAFVLLGTTLSTPISIAILVGAAVAALSSVKDAADKTKKAIEDISDTVDEFSKSNAEAVPKLKKLWQEGKISTEQYTSALETMRKTSELIGAMPLPGMEETSFGELFKKFPGAWKEFWGGLFQFGGTVPGPIGQPIPIIAHGGERVIPSRDRGGGGNTTINFYGATVREDADLNRIAQKVNAILGQQQRLKRLGG